MLVERAGRGAPMTAALDEDGKSWRRVWLPCEPLDRDSAAMMNFILAACQAVKKVTYERIERGDRKGSIVPRQKTRDQWLAEFLKKYSYADEVPRYALRNAMDKIMEEGTRKRPEARQDWNLFAVEARKGWYPHRRYRPRVTWEQWSNGEETKERVQRVTASGTASELFETGEIYFRWAKIRLTPAGVKKLEAEMALQEVTPEQLIVMVTSIEFAKRKNGWWLNFSFA